MVQTGPLRPFVVREHLPGSVVQADGALCGFARNISQTVYPPTCTCRMGPDAMSVVDESLRVRAYENRRVADVSLISEGGFTLQAPPKQENEDDPDDH